MDTMTGPSYILQTIPEVRMPLIGTFLALSKVFAIEMFHCELAQVL